MVLGSKLTAVAVLSVSAVFSVQVHASVLSFSDLANASLNTGTVAFAFPTLSTYSGSDYSSGSYTTTYSNFSVQTVAPTSTTQGLALDYLKTTNSYVSTVTTYKEDSSAVAVVTNGSTIGAGKYLEITGKVTSTVDTAFHFNLNANGLYGATDVPGVGSIPNGSISFFSGPTAATIAAQASSTTTYSPQSLSFDASSSGVLNLLAGQSVTFAALVYSSNASLSDFTISGYTDHYDLVTTNTPHVSPYDTLVGSHLVAAVPEPESYAMLLAGLGLMGAIAKRRKAKQA